MATGWRLDLPWTVPPLSLNDRSHWAKKARKVREVRQAAGWLARQANIPACPRIRVQLHYEPKTHRRRDGDNLQATFKPCVDGLVDAGVVADDTDELVERLGVVIHAPFREGGGRLWLTVHPLDEERSA